MLKIVPATRAQANDFVRRLHRHNKPVAGFKFAVAVVDEAGQLRGVGIFGRPVARELDDGLTGEITRVCTDGARNACSMLYGALRRAGRAMGYTRIVTYTLPAEGGASLRAAGFRLDKETAGDAARKWHSRPGRGVEAVGDDLVGGKWRWIDTPVPVPGVLPSAGVHLHGGVAPHHGGAPAAPVAEGEA